MVQGNWLEMPIYYRQFYFLSNISDSVITLGNNHTGFLISGKLTIIDNFASISCTL